MSLQTLIFGKSYFQVEVVLYSLDKYYVCHDVELSPPIANMDMDIVRAAQKKVER